MQDGKIGTVAALLGAPGSGKSTCASWLFVNLRLNGVNCELVGEFAKDLFWDDSNAWQDQLYVFANQWHMVDRVLRKTDVVVTDSPPILSLFYNRPHSKTFVGLVEERCLKHPSRYFLLKRSVPYDQNGRRESESQADRLHEQMKDWLQSRSVPFTEVNSSVEGWKFILESLLKEKANAA